ncbi:MAG: hypothetical protein ABIP13_01425 [Tepidiformaceae bacterium]
MTTDGPEGDDRILARLQESAVGDAAVRQLRRRYDLLRGDYENLLDRLGELEERLTVQSLSAQQAGPSSSAPLSVQLSDVLTAPLLKLRDDYVTAASRITSLVSGLETLAHGSFKGQRGVPEASPNVATASGPGESAAGTATDESDQPTTSSPRAQRVHLDVRGQGFGELLDFQERLSTIDGVARVSINAIDTERATLVVELKAGAGQHRAVED